MGAAPADLRAEAAGERSADGEGGAERCDRWPEEVPGAVGAKQVMRGQDAATDDTGGATARAERRGRRFVVEREDLPRAAPAHDPVAGSLGQLAHSGAFRNSSTNPTVSAGYPGSSGPDDTSPR
jgi:hypothetical protein